MTNQSMEIRNAKSFPEVANEVFDIIQEQLFTDQFVPEVSAELDKVFIQTITDENLDNSERQSFLIMYITLKKLLIVISKKEVPKNIKTIDVDISFYFK